MRIVSCFLFILIVTACNKSNDASNPIINVTTLAGSIQGFADGSGNNAKFYSPNGICVDAQGNVYVADSDNNKIRKITPAGVVTTFAGSTQGYTDGDANTAKFNNPHGVCVDAQGNVYVSDTYNQKIRKITPSGMVSTIAGSTQGYMDGSGSVAKFYWPIGICVDLSGNIYVAEEINHKIRKITPAGIVTTVAGSTGGYADGNANSAKFNNPTGICLGLNGNIYVVDYSGHKIRKITPAGIVSTVAGSTEGYAEGTGSAAQFDHPWGLCADGQGNIYVTDMFNHRIRKIAPEGIVSTFAGSTEGYADGSVNVAQFWSPVSICIDIQGDFYIGDYGNHKIRKISLK